MKPPASGARRSRRLAATATSTPRGGRGVLRARPLTILAEERSEDRTALRELEDSAIRDAVRRQIDLVWDVVTDGEPRRCMLLSLPTEPIG